MKTSETIASLAVALSATQGEIDDATKKGLNPAFRSKYADLAAVRAVIREPMAKHGLSVVQCPRTTILPNPAGNPGAVFVVEVETTIFHKSGEFISETLRMPVIKQDAHGIGSAITYARRYSLMSMLCMASEDDDGNAAANAGQSPKQAAPRGQTEAVLAGARAVAANGLKPLRAWFKGLDADTRSLIGDDDVAELVSIAKKIDAERDGE